MENIKVMSVEEIRREISEKYPAFKDGELEALGLKCIGGSSSGDIYFLTDSGSEIDVRMSIGKWYGTIKMSDPADKSKFSDNLLKNTAMRLIRCRYCATFPIIYRYEEYIRSSLEKDKMAKNLELPRRVLE